MAWLSPGGTIDVPGLARFQAEVAMENAGRETLSAHIDQIDQNIERVAAAQRREWATARPSQRRVERLSRIIGRPAYLIVLAAVIALWVGFNFASHLVGHASWDPPPFPLLDSVMTFLSLITTTTVLIAQTRQSKLEQQHSHLDLQVNLLTEQKVTKLIHLLEELRKDMPMVKDRHDPQAAALQEHTDALQVVSAIEEHGLTQGEVSEKPRKD
jgi:uncharacterized membrane protein